MKKLRKEIIDRYTAVSEKPFKELSITEWLVKYTPFRPFVVYDNESKVYEGGYFVEDGDKIDLPRKRECFDDCLLDILNEISKYISNYKKEIQENEIFLDGK